MFLVGTGTVLYVLAGYPLLLALLARNSHRPVMKRLERKTVTIVLPVRNGEQFIRRKLESLLALEYPAELVEVIVVSDGSTDHTDAIVREFDGSNVRLIVIPPSGKAVALNTAMENARGEILFFTDVRQPIEKQSLASLIACFADPQVGAACGELIILDGETNEEASVGLYWKYEKWLRKQLTALDSLLVVTGCIFAMRRELTVSLPADTLGDDIYLPQAAFLRGYRVVFEPGARAYDYPTSMDVEFRRKVRTLAAMYQYLGRCYMSALGRQNRMKFHFLSYKVGRLALPYALLLVAISSPWLPGLLAPVAVLSQIAFYGFAAMDPLIPERSIVKRISSPARAFVMLMVASLWAVSVFFVPAKRLWQTTRVNTRSH